MASSPTNNTTLKLLGATLGLATAYAALRAKQAATTTHHHGNVLAAQTHDDAMKRLSDPTAIARNKRLVRRHSSGDFAYLPTPADTAAKKAALKNFGTPSHRRQPIAASSPSCAPLVSPRPTSPPPLSPRAGVPEGAIQDSEGSQLPTTRGY